MKINLLSLITSIAISIFLGLIIIPILKKYNFSQRVSLNINERHLKKDGTPTMGGLIFIISTLLCTLLFIKDITINLIILIYIFIIYGVLGFIDDYLKIKYHNNKGLSIILKLLIEVIIALIFYLLFITNDNNKEINILSYDINLGLLYGFLILGYLILMSNSVNITDGLDGLCAGLCSVAFLSYGLFSLKASYILGYKEISIFCFIISGSLIGYLFFNFYPAKVFMGDLGSLCLGGTLAALSIILKMELSIFTICLVFIIEFVSSLIQVISIRIFHRKIFLKSPLHHHFEELGLKETEIIKIFYLFEILMIILSFIIYL